MDSDRNVLELCKPLSVKLIRLSNSEINRWKKGIKYSDILKSRRRLQSGSKQSNSKQLKVKKNQKQKLKSISSNSNDELYESQISSNKDIIMTSNENGEVNEANSILHEIGSESMDGHILPKNNISINDKLIWKYKRKRRKIMKSTDKTLQICKNSDELKNIKESSNSKLSNDDYETASVKLSKEIKIVSPRLEDSHDPQVERWRSKKKTSLSLKSKQRLTPKSNSLACTVCSVIFDSKEELSDHIFKHTQRELQEAYKAAKTKLLGSENNDDIENTSAEDDADVFENSVSHNTFDKSPDMEAPLPKGSSQITLPASLSTNVFSKELLTGPMIICSCHTEHDPKDDASVQIEMVLFCETCHVLFRRNECFETHYRFSSICNEDRTKGRTPKLFCSTCRVILNNLSNMRRHLEEHASVNFNRSVTFVCNICRVVFLGVGTVFCTHWFNHEKDSTFVASRYSFPKLCVSTQGKKPTDSAPDEQYLFVAEYVCRLCKFQFSSESELAQHKAKDCESPAARKRHAHSKSTHLKITSSNLGPSKTNSEIDVPKNDSALPKPIDMIHKRTCEFCDEFCLNHDAIEENNSKHLQDDGYPGYFGVFQSNASEGFVCNVCWSVYKTLQDLMKHWFTHDIINFICSACNEKCSSYSSLEMHISLACWRLKPDHRVWLSHQQNLCKICKSMHKTTEELAHHYAFKHITRTNTIPISSLIPSHIILKIVPESGTTTNPRLEKNCLKQQAIVKSSNSTDSQIGCANYALQNSNLPVFSKPLTSGIENSVVIDQPIQELSTIKITIPNLLEKPTITCQAESKIDQATSSNSIHEKKPEICESASTSNSNKVKKSIDNEREASDSSIITEASKRNSSDACETIANISLGNSCLRKTSVITRIIANSPSNNNNTGMINTSNENSHLLQAMEIRSPNFILPISSNNNHKISDESESNNKNNAMKIITVPKKVDNVSDITNEESESRFSEPEIITITNNLVGTTNTHGEKRTSREIKLIPLKDCEWECPLESECSSKKFQSLHEKVSNNENKDATVNDYIKKADVCPNNSDESKSRGYLRVKNFTELQAIRNYICHLCAAAFDNVMSLEEHVIAHERRPIENKQHPKMMAALILPQVEPSTEHSKSVEKKILPKMPHMAGSRILPKIPQRVPNANGRKVNALVRGLINNNSHKSFTIHNSTNTQNATPEQPYTYSMSLGDSREDFTNHVAINHFNINVSDSNTNGDSPIIFHKVTNAITKKQVNCENKICKYSTRDTTTADKHADIHHVNRIQYNTNIVPTSNTELVQRIDPPEPNYDRRNPNIVPPFKCSLCTNYQYNTIKELSQHFQTVHYPNIGKDICHSYYCRICLHIFQTYDELNIHTSIMHNSHQNTRWT